MNGSSSESRSRVIALVGLCLTIGLAIGAWAFLDRASTTGVERLARIDRARTLCTAKWGQARSPTDTARIDRFALPDTIDRESERRIDVCADLRGPTMPNALPNPREMSGEPMPRGLR